MTAAGMSTARACRLAGVSRATWYRHLTPPARTGIRIPHKDRAQPATLSHVERDQITTRLALAEFADLSVAQVFWETLRLGTYVASLRTWHRVARSQDLSGDRRQTRSHVRAAAPKLACDGPGQLWSWDITRIPTIGYRRPLHLYVIIDVYSRKPVAWHLDTIEAGYIAADLVEQAVTNEAGVVPLTLHSDGGAAMTSTDLLSCLNELGIKPSRSRPKVSNDNPFIEALFKTMKYDLSYPRVFESSEHAETWIGQWMQRYTQHHHHSSLAGYTPEQVHTGAWRELHTHHQRLLDHHWQQHPARYTRQPKAPKPAGRVHINHPEVSQTG